MRRLRAASSTPKRETRKSRAGNTAPPKTAKSDRVASTLEKTLNELKNKTTAPSKQAEILEEDVLEEDEEEEPEVEMSENRRGKQAVRPQPGSEDDLPFIAEEDENTSNDEAAAYERAAREHGQPSLSKPREDDDDGFDAPPPNALKRKGQGLIKMENKRSIQKASLFDPPDGWVFI
jgi:hypothetical protein